MGLSDYIVHTEDFKIPVREIFSKIKHEEIITDPDYQRNYIYDEEKASAVIESIMVGIPLPPIYTSENEDSTVEVIDGVQRLTSLVNFIDNKFTLKGLTILKNFNGKCYKDLSGRDKTTFRNQTIRIINFKKSCSEEVKFEVFARLNQGAATLNEQELRNCLYRGYFNDRIKHYSNEEHFIELTDYMKECDVNRLAREEFILRILCVLNYGRISKKTPTVTKQTMNKLMNTFRNTHDIVNDMFKEFQETYECIYRIIGSDAFYREFTSEEKKHNDPMIYAMFLAFRNYKINDLIGHRDLIRYEVDQALDVAYEKKLKSIEEISELILTGLCKHVYNGPRCFSYEIKEKLFNENNKCAHCGQTILSIDDAEVDHIIAFSQGGTTTLDNAQLLCVHCNRSKQDKPNPEPPKKGGGFFSIWKK